MRAGPIAGPGAGPPVGLTELANLPPLREVIAAHGLSARKSLGQNFLLDLNLTRRIARAAAPLDGVTVLEIGPGPGGLTRGLLEEGARHVVAVERDARCVAALREIEFAAPGKLTVIEGDALSLDLAAIAETHGRMKVVANLPYNVATPLLIGWLKRIELFDGLVLMFQKEVADRLVAKPGSRIYGRLSVAAQWRCTARPLFTLPPRAFVPPPKVESTVVEFIPRAEPLAPAEPDVLEELVAAAFGQRRKMLRAALRALDIDIAACGIDPQARAETLTIEEFCRLARALEEARNPGRKG